jgi:phosphoserine phosphatase RsbU/P
MPLTPEHIKNSSPFDLQPLVDFTRTINSSFDLEFILNNVLFTLMGKLLFTRGAVLLREENEIFRVAKVKGLQGMKKGDKITISPLPQAFGISNETDHFPWIGIFRTNELTHILDLTVRDELIGLIALGKRISGRSFDEREEVFLRSLVNIAATAIEKAKILVELREANRKLDNRLQELNTLFEISKEFGTIFRRDQLVKILVFSLLGHLGLNRYVIAMKKDDRCEVLASRFPVEEVKQTVLHDTMNIVEPSLVSSVESRLQPDTRRCLADNKIEAIIPMTIQGETRGIMLLGQRMVAGTYTATDLEFLSSLANLAIISIENIRLFEETLEKQRLEEELKIAREIQQNLLPKAFPPTPGYLLAANTISSKQVGGDYFDIVKLDEHRTLLVIADVSGKGTPAALLMSNLQATIRALAPLDISITEATARVNELIYDNTAADKFITMFWAILDVENHTLKYVNAGHNPPYHIKSDGTVDRLEKGGMILGVMRSLARYEHDLIALSPEDMVVFFTDGITEAIGPGGEEYGEERLERFLKENARLTPNDMLQALVASVNAFSGGSLQSDDITALILKVK